MAAKGLAKATIGAAGPPVIVLRQDRPRRRKRVIAELPGRAVKNDARLIVAQWRQRIFAPARRLEHVAAVDLVALQIAGLARHAELVFGAIVVGLQIGIAQWPVGERGILRDRRCAVTLDRMRAGAEVVLVKPPRHRAVMHGSAARLIAVTQRRQRVGARIGIWSPGYGLALDIGAQVLALEEAQFIVWGKVLGRQPRSPLQADDFHARFAELGC